MAKKHVPITENKFYAPYMALVYLLVFMLSFAFYTFLGAELMPRIILSGPFLALTIATVIINGPNGPKARAKEQVE